MKLEDFSALFTQQKWPELIEFLSSMIEDSSFRAGVSAQKLGDTGVTKTEKESYYKKLYAKQKQETIAYIQAKDQLNLELQKVLNLKPRQFVLSFYQHPTSDLDPSHRASDRVTEGELYFSEEEPDQLLADCVERIKKFNIQAHRHFSYGSRSINLLGSPQVLLQKLTNTASQKLDMLAIEPEKRMEQQQSISTVRVQLPFEWDASSPLIKDDDWANSPQGKHLLVYLQNHSNSREQFEGALLSLAVRSGILNFVQYIYEHTDATVETGAENPTEETTLMIAVSLGDEPIVRYLLEHGGNPNGKVFASDTTPLNIAIKKKNARLIKLLINAGAIVTSDEVTLAIDKGLDQETIECLLHHSVNSENLFSPYLISLVRRGDVALLQNLENHPLISSLKALDQFYEGEFDAHLVSAASESGSIEMVRYLIEVKQIDFKGLVIQDMEKEDRYLAEQAGNPKFQYLLNSSRTCLSVAVRTNAAFVRFLFEDLNLRPSPIIIQELCGRHAFSFKVVAYLLSLLEQSFEKAQELLSIGLDHSLSLVCLFKLFNSALILQGNPHRSPLSGNGFIYEVAALIKEKAQGLDAASLLKLLHENPEATEGALFYYCSEEFAEQTEQFFFLLNEVMKQGLSLQTVDIQNINGESLAVFAYEQGCYCLVDKLLARGANPDLPDHEGRTLINRVLDHIFSDANQLKWVSGYAHDMTHSLRYASKAACSSQSQLEALLKLSGGQIHGLTINELLENSIALETHDGTGGRFTSLFVHLSEHNAQEMVRLLKDPAFLAQHFKIKKEAPRLLSILSAIDASRLPAADKARRLSPMDSCDRAYSEKSWSKMHSFFSPLESSDFSENEGLNVTHRI